MIKYWTSLYIESSICVWNKIPSFLLARQTSSEVSLYFKILIRPNRIKSNRTPKCLTASTVVFLQSRQVCVCAAMRWHVKTKEENLWFIKDGHLQSGVNFRATMAPMFMSYMNSQHFSVFEIAANTYIKNENLQKLQTKP